ncbi:hypothetical protein HHI36_006266 [Cryptolaemus montrouzieri]|uniref:Endonuclease/exonuclease/phosphatase domain-containing protein n=1 Tax=Cryptolaemus montrouzieri TaxID=559131 RepID=A0ABD2NXJ5_9CUCU
MAKALIEISEITKDDIIIAGDINFCFNSENIERKKVQDLMDLFGLHYMFSEPSRDSSRCVDNIFTNINISNKVTKNIHLVDYYAQLVEFPISKAPVKNKSKYTGITNDEKYKHFLEYIEIVNWNQIQGDAESCYNTFHDIFMGRFDYCFSVKKCKIKKGKEPDRIREEVIVTELQHQIE